MSRLPRLIAITDLSILPPERLVSRLEQLALWAAPGALAMLLRDHGASGRTRLALGRELKLVAERTGQQLWVADRVDLARLLGAHGLHLGEASVSATTARRLLAPDTLVSRAWHVTSPDERALQALDGVDALLVSPLVAPRKGRPALGLEALGVLGEQLRARNQACPLYALGGISAENAADCVSAGAVGVAAIGAALEGDAERLLEAVGALRR